MSYKEIYNTWVENNYFDEKTREELKNAPVLCLLFTFKCLTHWKLEAVLCFAIFLDIKVLKIYISIPN